VRVLRHHEHDAGLTGPCQDRVGLGQGPCDRLLEEDGLAVLGRQARVRLVQVVRGAHDQRVDARVGGGGFVGAEGREPPEAPAVRLRSPRVAARERDPHGAAQPSGGARVERREPSASHECQTERAGAGPRLERSNRRGAARMRNGHLATILRTLPGPRNVGYNRCMRNVAVVGIGVTKFGKHERTCAELFADAAVDALTDADIRPRQIQGVYVGNVVGEAGERQLHLGPQVTSALGIPEVAATRFETACASSHAAFRHALFEIASGAADVLLVGGAERVLTMPTERSTEVFAYASDAVFEQPAGLTFPGVFALIARAHMAKHGTTEEQMAHVAVKNHRHGALNPKAQFQKEITLDQVLRSAKVADPLKLYDCCPFSDGAAAVVLASEEVARKTRKPVWVLGSAQAGDSMCLHDKRDLARAVATERAALAAYRQAGLGPRDVDVVELHDCFTIAEIVATEGLGLCEPGTGGIAAEKGDTSLGGRIPVNVSGGLKAKGHPIGATGAAQVAEIATQLRGEAGRRQVEHASVGLTHTLGGNTATVLVSLFGREPR
jgi:acetyl-CoA acetyltransferase